MASKDGKESEPEASDGLPPSIIAQAEAAIYANLKRRRRELTRSNTDGFQDTSRSQTSGQTSQKAESPLTR